MKIRSGFVSNSSTTSFCIYGARFDEAEVEEFADNKKKKDGDWECLEFSKFQKKAEKAGFELYYSGECECAYVGRSPTTIEDDETGADFKKSTEEAMKKLFGKSVACEFHTEELPT
jgi:hypothetical protein